LDFLVERPLVFAPPNGCGIGTTNAPKSWPTRASSKKCCPIFEALRHRRPWLPIDFEQNATVLGADGGEPAPDEEHIADLLPDPLQRRSLFRVHAVQPWFMES